MKNKLALSVRQPYAEQIINGTKTIEYRSRSTNIRGSIFIYATLKTYNGVSAGNLQRGLIIGTVEIHDCKKVGSSYHWLLRNPRRINSIKPSKQPQPVFFKPF